MKWRLAMKLQKAARFFHGLKPVDYQQRFATRTEANTAIFAYIATFHNCSRFHSSLAPTSPTSF